MDNASFQFVFFGLVLAIVSNGSRSKAWRSAVLFLGTLIFLILLSPGIYSLLPMLVFLLMGYALLVLMARGWSRFLPWILVVVIFIYVWLKRYTFLPQAGFLPFAYMTLGLSYVFFRVLHLLVDTANGGCKEPINLASYLLYTLNFTTFISGPIQRYDEFSRDQFARQPIPLDAQLIGLQLARIVRGFFKVNVLAMLLNTVRVDALAQMYQPLPTGLRMWAACRLVVAYPLFLYANFSGYIDIVIALARLMRLRLPENFDRPFSASSVIEFWNRWHITLSAWLRSYVFNPLLVALMRRSTSANAEPYLAVLCFFVTFFLIGVWHGRTSEFIVFGLLTGAGMSINRTWQLVLTRILGRKGYKALAKQEAYVVFGRGLNFVWFSFTLFWFWGSWREINPLLHSLSLAAWAGVWLLAWLSIAIALACWEWLRETVLSIRTAAGPVVLSRYVRTLSASLEAVAAVVVTVLLQLPAPAIVYKAF